MLKNDKIFNGNVRLSDAEKVTVKTVSLHRIDVHKIHKKGQVDQKKAETI